MQTKQEDKTYLLDIKKVLTEEAEAIIEFSDNISNEFIDIIDLLLNCKGRVIITGVGKSGIIGRKMVATFASTGTPSLFLHPTEGLHGDLGMVTKSDVIIALSNSGESDEVLSILPSINIIGARLISIVGNSNSTLALKSDYTISFGKIREACPLGLAPTTSTTLTLAIGDALAISLLKARDFKPENFAVFHPGGSLGKKLLLTVNDILEIEQKNPKAYIHEDVKDIIFKMTDTGLGAISVVNNSNKLIGILTDGDLRRALSRGENILNLKVENLYNPSPIKISSNQLAIKALKLMEGNNINVLPVVDEVNNVLGILNIQSLTKVGLNLNG
ncbi:KpsF/GutQ family sugar-phosphate isomerase [Priestia aryabhattai]|uniref:KpsF/GutQ family sugar-phosphate isomerase n=1 Tax=Priestia aryabhattai TaxID=412384 RepID=UPI002E22E985|nr:KpsF/GutQ family sugar-phosphate isomerase [Priestia aryabhattai]MED3955199.1 KpsF/GutQ family sugar-phosphate isomerase [Priestia aryabhattai]